jgi:hypothetical protein
VVTVTARTREGHYYPTPEVGITPSQKWTKSSRSVGRSTRKQGILSNLGYCMSRAFVLQLRRLTERRRARLIDSFAETGRIAAAATPTQRSGPRVGRGQQSNRVVSDKFRRRNLIGQAKQFHTLFPIISAAQLKRKGCARRRNGSAAFSNYWRPFINVMGRALVKLRTEYAYRLLTQSGPYQCEGPFIGKENNLIVLLHLANAERP